MRGIQLPSFVSTEGIFNIRKTLQCIDTLWKWESVISEFIIIIKVYTINERNICLIHVNVFLSNVTAFHDTCLYIGTYPRGGEYMVSDTSRNKFEWEVVWYFPLPFPRKKKAICWIKNNINCWKIFYSFRKGSKFFL